jgi:hypothetical protein
MTKYEVLKLMQSAYDTRSAVAHGGCLIRKNMKSSVDDHEIPGFGPVTIT